MSAIVRKDHNGVLLRYDDGSSFVPEQRPRRSDLERIAVMRAEKRLKVLEIILEHLTISDMARERIDSALDAVYEALDVKRGALGMSRVDAR